MAILGILGNEGARKGAVAANKQAEGYTLPYLFKVDSMDGNNKLSTADLGAMKQMLEQAKLSALKNG